MILIFLWVIILFCSNNLFVNQIIFLPNNFIKYFVFKDKFNQKVE
jgi:hypothetical protein